MQSGIDMQKSFIIRDEGGRIAALLFIEEAPLDKPLEVSVCEYKPNRSAAQRRLQWLWNTQLGNHLGLTKDEIHLMIKEKFAVPIFTRDDQGYAEMVESVKAVRRAGMNRDADALKREIVKRTSTEDFSVAQAAEYLTEMERFAAEKGAAITYPADVYNDAMGRTR